MYIYVNKKIPKQIPELYYGNKEYKWKWCKESKLLLNKRATQLLFRLNEGHGKAIYILGILDNGYTIGISDEELRLSLIFMKKIVNIIDADIHSIRIYEGLEGGYVATVRITKKIDYQGSFH
jgi:GTPase